MGTLDFEKQWTHEPVNPSSLGFDSQIFNSSSRRSVLNRLNAVFHAGFGGVHLAAADDLLVGCQQVEVEFAVGGFLAFKAAIIFSVLHYAFGAILGTGFAGVTLAGEDDLPVFGLQAEIKLVAFFAFENLKLHKACGLMFWIINESLNLYVFSQNSGLVTTF